MNTRLCRFRSFLFNDDGLETVEYAIILGLIVIGVLGSLAAIGAWVSSKYQAVQNAL